MASEFHVRILDVLKAIRSMAEGQFTDNTLAIGMFVGILFLVNKCRIRHKHSAIIKAILETAKTLEVTADIQKNFVGPAINHLQVEMGKPVST